MKLTTLMLTPTIYKINKKITAILDENELKFLLPELHYCPGSCRLPRSTTRLGGWRPSAGGSR